MSNPSEAARKVINKLLLERVDYCLQLSSVAVLYYDYILTLPAEIEHFWKNPRKLTTLLYACCRYALIANVLHLVLKTEGSSLRSDTVNLTTSALALMGHFGIISVWALRTRAICQGNKVVTVVVASVGLSVLILRLAILIIAFISVGANGFNNPQWTFLGILIPLSVTNTALMMIFEATAFFIAAFKAWKTLREDAKFWVDPQSSLNTVVFSQGLLYISAVFSMSILATTFNLRLWEGVARPMNSFKLPLSALLSARFLLKLKIWERHQVVMNNTSAQDGKSSTMEFTTAALGSSARGKANAKGKGKTWTGGSAETGRTHAPHESDETHQLDVIGVVDRSDAEAVLDSSRSGGGTARTEIDARANDPEVERYDWTREFGMDIGPSRAGNTAPSWSRIDSDIEFERQFREREREGAV